MSSTPPQVELVIPFDVQILWTLEEIREFDPDLDAGPPSDLDPNTERKTRGREELYDIVVAEITTRYLADIFVPLDQVNAEWDLVVHPGYGTCCYHKREWGDMSVIVPGPQPSVVTRLVYALTFSHSRVKRFQATTIDTDYRGRQIRFVIAFGTIVGVYEVKEPHEPVFLHERDEGYEEDEGEQGSIQ